jgi:predicted regulator of Ras-like GTPase activity (Roadblock/LC7/MglB family)
MNIDPQINSAAESAIQKLMDNIHGIKAVVISTEDGFEIAAWVENTAQVSRLAAMASSMAALGAIAGEESQLGTCDNIMIEAPKGYLTMMQARHPKINLIISIITDKDAVMGQVLYFSRQVCKTLENATL